MSEEDRSRKKKKSKKQKQSVQKKEAEQKGVDYVKVVEKLQDKITKLEVELQAAMEASDSDNDDAVETLMQRISKKEIAMKFAQTRLQGKPAENEEKRSMARVTRLPLNLPRWSSTPSTTKQDCVKYLESLEYKFQAELFPENEQGVSRWVHALLNTVQDRDELRWVQTNLVAKNVSWTDMKPLFYKRMVRVTNFLAPAQDLEKVRQKTRPMASHCESFTARMRDALVQGDGSETVDYNIAQKEPIYSLANS